MVTFFFSGLFFCDAKNRTRLTIQKKIDPTQHFCYELWSPHRRSPTASPTETDNPKIDPTQHFCYELWSPHRGLPTASPTETDDPKIDLTQHFCYELWSPHWRSPMTETDTSLARASARSQRHTSSGNRKGTDANRYKSDDVVIPSCEVTIYRNKNKT